MPGVLYRNGRRCFARHWLVVMIWLVLLAGAGIVLTAVLIATRLLPANFGTAGARLNPRPGSRAARLASRTAYAGEPGRVRPTLGARCLAAVTGRPAGSWLRRRTRMLQRGPSPQPPDAVACYQDGRHVSGSAG